MRRLLHRRKEKRANRSAATRNLPETMVPGRYAILMKHASRTHLSAAERRQWFDVLLAAQLDDRILALQSQGIFTDPQSYITYATALAYRGEKSTPPALSHLKISRCFTTDAQEKKLALSVYLNTAPTPFRRWRIIRCSLPITASMLLARRYRCC